MDESVDELRSDLGSCILLCEAHDELGLKNVSGTASISLERCFELEIKATRNGLQQIVRQTLSVIVDHQKGLSSKQEN